MVSKINQLKTEGNLWSKMRAIYSGTEGKPGIGFTGLWAGLPVRIFMVGSLTGIQWWVFILSWIQNLQCLIRLGLYTVE